jgi:hypothetical protein
MAMDNSQTQSLNGQGVNLLRKLYLNKKKPESHQRGIIPSGGDINRAMSRKGLAMTKLVPLTISDDCSFTSTSRS